MGRRESGDRGEGVFKGLVAVHGRGLSSRIKFKLKV